MQLNYLVPFVTQVKSFSEGLLSIDVCRNTLAEACVRYDISLKSPWLILNENFSSIDPRMPGVFLMPDEGEEAEALWDTWVINKYYPFLTETNLVLQPSRFSNEYELILGRYIFRPTARAWAAAYANWANAISWLGKTDWNYINFYSGNISDDYWDWAEAAFKVVKELSPHP